MAEKLLTGRKILSHPRWSVRELCGEKFQNPPQWTATNRNPNPGKLMIDNNYKRINNTLWNAVFNFRFPPELKVLFAIIGVRYTIN